MNRITTLFTILLLTASLTIAQTTQPTVKPKIGVIVSKANAAVQLEDGPTGFNRMTRIVKEITDGDFEFIPLIDHGTKDDPVVAQVCRETFPNAQPIDLTDADALSKLDVIIASHVMRIDAASLKAVDTAVQNGTGMLIRMYFGNRDPGPNDPTIAALSGLEPGTVKYLRDRQVECQATQEHPIVGVLASSMERVTFNPNGMYGKYTGSPLIEVCEDAVVKAPGRENETIALVYTAKRGKGNIVVCPFAGSKPIPAKLEKAGDKSFGTRCLNWLISARNSEEKK